MPLLLPNIELVLTDKIVPPNPVDMLGGLDITEHSEVVTAVCGLRATRGDSYMKFCEQFLDCVCTDDVWKQNSRNTRLSDYVQVGLEAFGVITYVNGYDVWKTRYKEGGNAVSAGQDCGDTAVSSLSSGTITFKFTSGARGSRKYAGWSTEGMKLYNTAMSTLSQQRVQEETGTKFDDKLIEAWCTKRKRKEQINDAPRANNNLSQLMQKQKIAAV